MLAAWVKETYLSGTMAGRKGLTQECYDMLVIAFRECPDNAALAARRSLCGARMAKRLYDGRPYKDYPWAKQIKTVLEEERLHAMAAAREATRRSNEAAEAQRERAREEVLEGAVQERQILKVARGDVLGALVLAASLVPAMQQVAKAVAEFCKPGEDGSPPKIAPALAMAMLTRHATLVQKAVGAAEAVIQLSRLDRGASTINVGLAPAQDLSLDQALEELEAIEEVLTAAKLTPRLPELAGRAGR